jgi:hypothetical protein
LAGVQVKISLAVNQALLPMLEIALWHNGKYEGGSSLSEVPNLVAVSAPNDRLWLFGVLPASTDRCVVRPSNSSIIEIIPGQFGEDVLFAAIVAVGPPVTIRGFDKRGVETATLRFD